MVVSFNELGTAPSTEVVHEWMVQAMGLIPTVVGKSFQGRDLVLYEQERLSSSIEQEEGPTILFLSLVHGNEPAGLLTLLSAVEKLRQKRLRGPREARLWFFPIVNIDAYTLNRDFPYGCRRTNMRTTCHYFRYQDPVEIITACPRMVPDGVDLNRNFPIDWNGTYSGDAFRQSQEATCSHSYHGASPFSEPETVAIRTVVEKYQVTAAMSFHTRAEMDRPALLIHPYTPKRPLGQMSREDLQKFRHWSKAMDPWRLYIRGTAQETIKYTAGGTTIDWLYSVNVTAFVVEIPVACNNRWCPDDLAKANAISIRHGATATRFVELVVHGSVPFDSAIMIIYLFVAAAAGIGGWLMWHRRHNITPCLRRWRRKDKHIPESQMQRQPFLQTSSVNCVGAKDGSASSAIPRKK